MTIYDTQPKPVRRDIERKLRTAEKDLRTLQLDLLQPDRELEALTAARDAAEGDYQALLARRQQLAVQKAKLRAYLGPVPDENDPELVAAIARTQREHDALAADISDAEARALRAVRRYNTALRASGSRKQRVRHLEYLISVYERELARLEPRASVLPRSWRDLITNKSS